MTTTDDKIRDSRYPHAQPVRSDFGNEADFAAALMIFYRGQSELTERFFEALPFAAVSTLGDGTIVYANAAAHVLFGLTEADLLTRRANDFLFDAKGNRMGGEIGKSVAQGEAIRQRAVFVRGHEGGEPVLRMLSTAPVYAENTLNLVRVIGFFMDPSACEHENASLRTLNQELNHALRSKDEDLVRLREENASLRALTLNDELTGVLNKSGFFREARQRIEKQRRQRGSAGVLFLDPDVFKRINDTYGHDVGDQVLQLIASRGRDVIEMYGGLFARFGGDEFFALIDGELDGTAFEKIASELAAALPFDYEAENLEARQVEQFRVEVSVGGSFRGGGAIPDFGVLRKDADSAMYECKRSRKAGEGKAYIIRFGHVISSKPPKAP